MRHSDITEFLQSFDDNPGDMHPGEWLEEALYLLRQIAEEDELEQDKMNGG